MEGQLASSLSPSYNPRDVEGKWYSVWEQQGYFGADPTSVKPKYCIVIPPPNVTGELHMGHGLQHVIHDCLIRWKRMSGYETLCVPGTDHASISTEMKVERMLRSEGLSKRQLGREEFLRRAWEWREHYGGRILEQLRALGCSYDWSRERFTLDEKYYSAVIHVFCRMYKKGWIYRGLRLVNWCPTCRTAISDLEVEHEEKDSNLWFIAYPSVDGEFEIVVATTRPETMVADTAVAIHPEDERYRHLVGKTVILPIIGRAIPIIADDYLDPTFGTGALKVTPAHDVNDYEIGLRHDLPMRVGIDFDGKMTEEAGPYQGMTTEEAREGIVRRLKDEGKLRNVTGHRHSVGVCDKCGTVIEPLPSEQWFVKMRDLATLALKAVPTDQEPCDGQVRFVPSRYAKASREWLENIRDWCVSRQLWWGHRIPIYYCGCGEVTCAEVPPQTCPKCGGTELRQDEDVLDTWFSSAIWPQVVLGWPEETPELRAFYPTDVLITARGILYLWVARMIMTSLEYTNKLPFRDVYVHATILDKDGKRMSKSLGNGVDPMDLITQYGTDATRMGTVLMAARGQDSRFSTEKFEHSRNFANKLWNATRFALNSSTGLEILHPDTVRNKLSPLERWILSRATRTTIRATSHLIEYDFESYARLMMEFVWSELCDWYIEGAKASSCMQVTSSVLLYVLDRCLRLLHPLMPFITEELWSHLKRRCSWCREPHLIVAEFPLPDESLLDEIAERHLEQIISIVRIVRNVRRECSWPSKERIPVGVSGDDQLTTAEASALIEWLGRAEIVRSVDTSPTNGHVLSQRVSDRIVLTFPKCDVNEAVRKLQQDILRLQAEVERAREKLANESFVSRAPAQLVADEKEKLQKYEAQLNEAILRRHALGG